MSIENENLHEDLSRHAPAPAATVLSEVSSTDHSDHAALQSNIGNSAIAAVATAPRGNGDVPPNLRTDIGNAALSRILILRKHEVSSPAGSPALPIDTQTGTASSTPATTAPRLIVEDLAETVAPGQMRKTEFLTQLQAAVRDTVTDALAATPFSAFGCPYIEQWFAFYSTQSSEHVEKAIRKYVPSASGSTTANSYISFITAHARSAVTIWARTGEVTGLPPGVTIPEGGLTGAMGSDTAGSASGIRTGFSNAPSGLKNIFFKHDDGSTNFEGDPEAIQAQLGGGQSLDAGVRSRMESAFGESFSNVQVHSDPNAAKLSEGLNARAFTVGTNIAFSAGEYQPGTLIGDALIAHELAHVMQQRNADSATGLSQKGEESHGGLEEDADLAAVSAVASVWGGKGGIPLLSQRTLPALKSGLRLQRCGGSSSKAEPDFIEAEEMAKRGFRLEPPPGEVTVGRTYKLSYTTPRSMHRPGDTPYSTTHWHAKRPGEKDFGKREGLGASHAWTLDKPGHWEFLVFIWFSRSEIGVLTHSVEVRSLTATTAEQVEKVPPLDVTGFLVRLELQNLQNIRLGVANQQFGGAYISLTGDNPAEQHSNYPNTPSNTYSIHPPPGVTPTRYQWLAVPEDLSNYPAREFFGRKRQVIGGQDAFNLGTGTTARWPLTEYAGVVEIYCKMYDGQGGLISEVRYHQVILTDPERKHAKAFQEYMSEVKEELRGLRHDAAIYVPAVHLNSVTGVSTEVSLFLGPPVTGAGLKLIDVTPGVKVREYGGTNFSEVLESLNSRNSYPPGQIRLRVPANKFGIQAQDWLVKTTGESFAQRLSSGWGWASLGLAALGVLAAIIPGTQGLAPAFFLASAGLGAASAGASLYQRSQEARSSNFGIVVDLASLAGSLLGFAGAANILRHGPRIAAVGRTGRFVLYAGFATDTMGGVFILAEGAQQIAAILEGPGNPDEKASAVTRILSGLLLNGSLLAWGAKDIRATRAGIKGVVGESMVGKLSNAELHALSLFEGPVLARLAGASLEEIQAIALLVRENPARAAKLIDQFGEGFVVGARSRVENLEELAQALHAGAPEAAGTRGSYGPPPPGGARPVYLEKPGVGESSPNNLASRIRSSFTNPSSPSRRPLANGASLREVAPGGTAAAGAPTRYELVIPASGTKAEIIIPVRIESTSTRPTSVHGRETGPARMEVRSSVDAAGATRYEANIEVHEDLAKSDVPHAVGHELDELTSIAVRGIRGSDITAQKHASLLRAREVVPGAAPPPRTAHDEAEARGFAYFVRLSSPIGGRHTVAGDFGMPPDLLSRSLSMGFGNKAHLEDKLALLRSAGIDEDMLRRLRTMAHQSEVRVSLPVGSLFGEPKIIGHFIHGGPGTPASPVSGAHIDSVLVDYQRELVAQNAKTHLVRTADSRRASGGVTYNAYEQWVWTGPGNPPPGSRPTSPAGASSAKHNDWAVAKDPKTTVDNLPAFLQHADATWRAWHSANPGVAGDNVYWSHTLPGGQPVAGFFSVDPSGKITHRSVFPLRAGGIASW